MLNPSTIEEIYRVGPLARLRQSLAAFADKPLIVCGDATLTRADIWTLSGGLAAALVDRGLVPGDRIGVYGGNSVWHYLTHWACLRAGLIWAPINPGLAQRDLDYTIGDLDPKLVFVAAAQRDMYASTSTRPSLPLDETLAELARQHEDRPPEPHNWRPGDPAYVMYSGGTTGLPKGIMLPYILPAVTALKYDTSVTLSEDDIIYSCMTMHHTWLFCLLTMALYADCTAHVAPRFSASRWYENVRAAGATVVDPFLPMVAMILRRTPPAAPGEELPLLRTCNGYGGTSEAGARLRREFEERFRVTTYEMYGLTEAPFIATSTPSASKRGAVGRTLPWFETRIVDQDDLELPAGEIGEITVRPTAPHQMSVGYLNKSDMTVVAWRNLFIHTGDRGFVDGEGYLYFVGREAHFARHKGENVSLTEVEGVLAEHPAVEDCAAVGVPSELAEDDIKVCVVPRGEVDPQIFVDWLAGRLASFKVPRYVEFVDAIPRSVTKQEIERTKLLNGDPGRTWDRDAARPVPGAAAPADEAGGVW